VIRALSHDEMQEVRDDALRCQHLIDWRPMRVPVSDPLIFGSYAQRTVWVTCWKGDLVYYEAKE